MGLPFAFFYYLVLFPHTMIYIAADHGGYALKNTLITFLAKQGLSYQDLGNFIYDEEDDYPDFAFRFAKKVAASKRHKGVLICGSGVGMVVAANKVRGIRAAQIFTPYMARQSREHDDVNVLVFGQKVTSASKAKKMLQQWLKTEFSKQRRYSRRVKAIKIFEH